MLQCWSSCAQMMLRQFVFFPLCRCYACPCWFLGGFSFLLLRRGCPVSVSALLRLLCASAVLAWSWPCLFFFSFWRCCYVFFFLVLCLEFGPYSRVEHRSARARYVLRSHHSDYTASHPNCEVKHCWAQSVLRWGTTRESWVPNVFIWSFFFNWTTFFWIGQIFFYFNNFFSW